MEAHGHLTAQDEFSGGRRVRLISYLGPDLAFGAPAFDAVGPMGIPVVSGSVALHHLSVGDAGQTIPIANAVSGGVTLSPGGAPDAFIVAAGLQPPYDQRRPVEIAAPESVAAQLGGPTLTVQFVQDCWFTIGPPGQETVFDVCAGATDEGTEILSFPKNGGQNQIWRAEVVQDGLGAGAPRPVAADRSAAPASPGAARRGLLDRIVAFLRRLLGAGARQPT